MKKLLILALTSLLALGLTGCGKTTSPETGDATPTPESNATGRLYHGFTLATTFNPEFDGYANWHSDNLVPYGTGSSGNVARYTNDKNDELLNTMRFANPATEEGKAEYQAAYYEWVKLMNVEMPLLPLYANDYHDLYNAKVQNFETNPLWQWPEAIIEATGVDSFTAGNTTFAGEFMEGKGNSAYDNNVRKLIFGGTGLFTVTKDSELEKNYMVDSYTSSEDLKTWNFKLKKGIKFSDGEELTANDVAFTYYFFADPSFDKAGGTSSYYPLNIEGFEAYKASCAAGACDKTLFTGINVINDYEIEFKLTDATFTVRSDNFTKYILAEHQLAPEGKIDAEYVYTNFMSNPIGSGPYKLVEWRQGEYVKLVKNEFFQGDVAGNVPTINEVIVQVVPTETEIDLLIAGEIDLLAGQVQEGKIDAAKADPNLTYVNYPRHGYGHLTWHNDFGPVDKIEVRQAIAYAIDRPAFIEDFMGKYGTIVQGPYSTVFWMIDDAWVDANLTNYSYDPAMVATTLEAAGWAKGDDGIYAKDGEKLIINVACGSADWADSLNLVTNKSVAETGIQFKFNVVDFAVLLEHYYGSYKG